MAKRSTEPKKSNNNNKGSKAVHKDPGARAKGNKAQKMSVSILRKQKKGTLLGAP